MERDNAIFGIKFVSGHFGIKSHNRGTIARREGGDDERDDRRERGQAARVRSQVMVVVVVVHIAIDQAFIVQPLSIL